MDYLFGPRPVHTLFRVFILLSSVYVLGGLALFFSQDDFIYFPPSSDFWSCETQGTLYEKREIAGERVLFAQGETLGQNTDRLIVFYHGNADSACDWLDVAEWFTLRGDDTLIVEFPGYAGDARVINQESLFTTVERVHQWLEGENYEEVYIVAFSLGSALSAYHASLGGVDKLLLVAPFDELIRVAWEKKMYYPRFLLRDNYDNVSLFRVSQTPLVILHGEEDEVISPRRSRRLAEHLGDQVLEYILVPGRGHGDVMSGQAFDRALDLFLLE